MTVTQFEDPFHINIADRWHEAAEKNIDTNERIKLYEDTLKAANNLTEEQADIILEIFDQYKIDKSEKLAQWISQNSCCSEGKVEGAYSKLHVLFQKIAKIKNCPNALTSEVDHSGTLSKISYIDAAACQYIDDTKIFLDNVPDEIIDYIFSKYDNSSPKACSFLCLTSKKFQKKALKSYTGNLKGIKIDTADKVIDFVKEYGKNNKILDISGIVLTNKQFNIIISYTPHLHTLNANSTEVNNINELSKSCKDLKIFNFVFNRKEKIKGLETFSQMTNLEKIDFSYNLIEIPLNVKLKNLKTLVLKYNDGLTSKQIQNLLTWDLKNLECLNLRGNGINDEQLQMIASSDIENLTDLDLYAGSLGDPGLQSLAASTSLLKLKKLNLSCTNITNESTILLINSPVFKNLEELDIFPSSINKVNVDLILNSLENLKIFNGNTDL